MSLPHRKRCASWKFARAKFFRKHPTPPERILWNLLCRKQLGVRFRRQEPMFGWIVDFWCPKAMLVVEVDGKCHENRVEQDAIRDEVLAGKGVKTLRFSARDVFQNARVVAQSIAQEVSARRRKAA